MIGFPETAEGFEELCSSDPFGSWGESLNLFTDAL
ncbi:hypothetical protein GGP57_000542 [Salinibacter ruber]|nr:hypothetical protein [Salinibacter ruber]MCS3633251.1 hypothetical protein [Salinibacter ruber]MCS3699265.1 hypothetical protein [Salinibacter ruber]MCS3712973.1 hypothetical protein [Salinibacter ruber]MCS3823486.1 hypothetical protein [Salinibacter ruber]